MTCGFIALYVVRDATRLGGIFFSFFREFALLSLRQIISMKFSLLVAGLLLPLSLLADDKKKKWDVENPGSVQKEVSFTVNEGTWMNLDVSPDGKEIVFDLLGDIYIMPVTGGKAKVLRGGKAMEVQPRFSPDGKKICFTSDAGGGR